MLLDKRQKVYLFATAAALLIWLIHHSLLAPLGRRWSQQNMRITKEKELLEKSLVLVDKKGPLTKRFAALSRKIMAKLPLEREEGAFLTEIGLVAEETNVHIVMMNPLPFRDLGSFKELSVEIDMEANLGNLVRFLYEMRRSSVVLVANRLRLRPKSERSALLKGHLVISTIFLKER